MRGLAAIAVLAGCQGHHVPPPPPAVPPSGPLTYANLWSIAGVGPASNAADVTARWGQPRQHDSDGDGGEVMSYAFGPSVTLRHDRVRQLDVQIFGNADLAFVHAHPDPWLALMGRSCDDTGLAFAPRVASQLTCTHRDESGWGETIQLWCSRGRLDAFSVVWFSDAPVVPDHCGP